MKAGAVVLEVRGQEFAEYTWLAPHVIETVRPGFQIEQLAVLFHQLNQMNTAGDWKQHAHHHHLGQPDKLAASDGLIHVERHGFMLGFLNRVPGPDGGHTRVHLFQSVIFQEEFLCHQCSEMLHRHRVGQLALRAQPLAQHIHQPQHLALKAFEVDAAPLHISVQGLVLF